MAKYNFSKTFMMDPSVLKQIAIKGDPNSPYAKTLKLRIGEAFVVYNATLDDVYLPYSRAKKLGMKFVTKSNFRLGEKKGLLVTRIS
jgi:hypothetical protein